MLSEVEVFILCGGEGKRLRSLVSNMPKPMAPIGDKPFLDFLVRFISGQGFKNFCFLTGYKSEQIISYCENNFQDLNFRISNENKPLGTAGSIIQATRGSNYSQIIAMNGDSFFKLDFKLFLNDLKPSKLKMALKPSTDLSRYGSVDIDNDGNVLSFKEKSFNPPAQGLINTGIYYFEKNIFDQVEFSKEFISLEQDVFPELLRQKKIYAQVFDNEFIDIGIPEDYISAQYLIQKWTKGKI